MGTLEPTPLCAYRARVEVIRRTGPWRHFDAVEFATLDCVDWFNTWRLLEPIGYTPPAEYEARYFDQAEVAGLTLIVLRGSRYDSGNVGSR